MKRTALAVAFALAFIAVAPAQPAGSGYDGSGAPIGPYYHGR